MVSEGELERRLLIKMYKLRVWGKHHICESNLQKRFAKHERGKVMEIARKLLCEGILVKRPSSHEHQWFLNMSMKAEVERRIFQEPI